MTLTASTVLDRLALPGDRPLATAELERVVHALATAPEIWAPHVDPSADGRTYVNLHRDSVVDVWALFWLPDNDTGWHDHDTSSGAVRVVEGALVEHALRVAGPDRRTRHAAGATLSFGPSHIHRLTCDAAGAVSMHAYSPPLWRVGVYSVDAGGALHRESVSYADELRPRELEEVAA